MANHRQDKINSAVEAEMASILREIKDPRVAGAFVTITAARVSVDLKYAKLYWSSLSGDKKDVAERLNLRITPEITFEEDDSIAHGARIAEVLRDLERERAAREEASVGEDNEAGSEDGEGEGEEHG